MSADRSPEHLSQATLDSSRPQGHRYNNPGDNNPRYNNPRYNNPRDNNHRYYNRYSFTGVKSRV